MATIDEHLEYLKDSSRFPKINMNAISDPQHQFSGAEYNRIIDTLTQVKDNEEHVKELFEGMNAEIATVEQPITLLTDEAFDAMVTLGTTIEDGIYFTYEKSTESEAAYDDESGMVTLSGASYSEETGIITISSATYDEESGIITI